MMIPINPKRDTPMIIPIRDRKGCISPTLFWIMGLRKLSTILTNTPAARIAHPAV